MFLSAKKAELNFFHLKSDVIVILLHLICSSGVFLSAEVAPSTLWSLLHAKLFDIKMRSNVLFPFNSSQKDPDP